MQLKINTTSLKHNLKQRGFDFDIYVVNIRLEIG